MRSLLPLVAALFLSTQYSTATVFTTTTNGNWGDPVTWGGVFVSSFFAPPVSPPNYFTAGVGDTIIVNHQVTMDYNIFVRSPDILIINPTGSITHNGANMNALYNLSPGLSGYTVSGIQAGVYVLGQLDVEFIRNNSSFMVGATGEITTDNVAQSGNFDNFGDLRVFGAIRLGPGGGDFEHNAGDVEVFTGGLIDVRGGDFNNRGVIRELEPNACILASVNFDNLLGGTVLGSGGFVGAVTGNVDNSANPIGNWAMSVAWCASVGSGINLPAIAEDCSIGCASPLPVELALFEGVRNGQVVDLNWQVLSEQNFSHYEVQRRNSESKAFESLASIQGNSNSQETQNYSYQDRSNNSAKTNYYRLKSVDVDGTFEYSETISVAPLNTQELVVFPNPVDSKFFYAELPNTTNGRLVLIDALGNEVQNFKIDSAQTKYFVNEVKSGVYLLKLYNADGGQVAVGKVVVQ